MKVAIAALALASACSRSAPAPSPLEPQHSTPAAPAPQPPGPPEPVAIAPQPPSPPPEPAEENADLAPSKAPRRFQILNGRLSAVLPAGSRLVLHDDEGPPDPGVAPQGGTHAIDAGDRHVRLASFELLAPAGPELEAEVRAGIGRWKRPPREYRLEALPVKAPLRVLQVTLPAPDRRAGLTDEEGSRLSLVTLLYVAHSDGTAQCVEVHANDAALADTPGVVATARAIGESFEVGPLGLPRGAGERNFALGEARVIATVPEGYVAIFAGGAHGGAVLLVKLAAIATAAPSIWMQLMSLDLPVAGPPVRVTAFGRPATLHRWSRGGRRGLEGLVEADEITSIAMKLDAGSAAELAELQAIAATMRFEAP